MKKSLFICESEKQVEFLIKKGLDKRENTIYVSANPDATHAYKKHNIEYVKTDDFQVHYSKEMIEDLLATQIKWANDVDSYLQNSIQSFKENNYNPLRYYLCFIKNNIDSYIHRVGILNSLKEKFCPDSVIFFNNHNVRYSDVLIIDASYFADIIPEWACLNNIKIFPLSAISRDRFWKTQRQMAGGKNILIGLKEIILSVNKPGLYNLYKKLKTKENKFFSNWQVSSSRMRVLVKVHYDINNEVCDGLIKKDIELISFDDICHKVMCSNMHQSPDFRRNFTEKWEEITKSDWFWKPLNNYTQPINRPLNSLFRYLCDYLIISLWNSYLVAIDLLKKLDLKAVFISNVCGYHEVAIIMAAKYLDIPVIFYMHGASMGDIENNIWDIIDSFYGTYMFLYGEGNLEYINSRPKHDKSSAIPVVVGSARLDEILENKKEAKSHFCKIKMITADKPTVIYIPGILSNNFFRYDHFHIKNQTVFDTREVIAGIFSKYININFIYKAFVSQGNDPTIQIFKKIAPLCKIVNDISLTELQWFADLLIYEIPSTGFYEGLLTNKPIIVWVDENMLQMPEKVRLTMKKRVIVAENSISFINSISNFLNESDFKEINNPDTEFLTKWLNYLNYGSSSQKVCDSIELIINKQDSSNHG